MSDEMWLCAVIGITAIYIFVPFKQIGDYEKNEDSIRTGQGKEDPFEFLYSKAQAQHKLLKAKRDKDDDKDNAPDTSELSESGGMVTHGEPIQTLVS